MDYCDDGDVPYPQHQRLQLSRPPMLQASHANYSSIAEGLDAKVVVMGNSAVGKTSLVQRFTENKFAAGSTMSTTGAFFVTKKVVVDGLKVRLQLWDTAGQERFRSMAPMYYRGANAAILCYDITDASSFDDIRKWLDELKQYQRPGSAHSSDDDEQPSLLIYVVGAKADLGNTKRAISLEQARRLLHTWYPPPQPPRATTPPPPPPSKLSTITTASGLSYIRPRFTSLTTSLSAPAPPPPTPALAPRMAARTRASHSYSVSPPPTRSALSRAQSARVVPVGTPLNDDRPAGAWKSARRPGGGIRERRWSDAMMWDDTMREEGAEDYYGSQQDAPMTDGTSEDADEYDIEEEWPLEKGMELFEVSAMDGRGVQALFDHLLANIIERKETIQREKALRERNSVMLDPNSSEWSSSANGSVAGKSERAASGTSAKGGWSCCAS